MQVEQLVPTSDGRDTSGQLVPSIHGTSGLVGISSQNVLTGIDGRVIKTTTELREFPFNEDMNSGNTIGVGEYSLMYDRARRLTDQKVGANTASEMVRDSMLQILTSSLLQIGKTSMY